MDTTLTKNTRVESVLREKINPKNKTLMERYREGESFNDLMRERVGSFEKRRQTQINVGNIFVNKYYKLELRLCSLLENYSLDNEDRNVKRKLEVLKFKIKEGLNELFIINNMKDNNETNYSFKSTRLFCCMSNLYNLRKEIEYLEQYIEDNLYGPI